MPADPAADLERLVAAAVGTPMALGSKLVGSLPATVSRVQQEVVLARFIGKMAVDQGRRELKRRLDGDPPADRRRSTHSVASAPDAARAADASSASDVSSASAVASDGAAADADAGGEARVPSPNELALADYDQLPASQIVAMLGDLTPTERRAIGVYEVANRNRRTVLGRLAQLT